MRNFSYCNPTRILFGAGQIASLGQLIPADSRVLVTHGGGSILQNGDHALYAAKAAGRDGYRASPGSGSRRSTTHHAPDPVS